LAQKNKKSYWCPICGAKLSVTKKMAGRSMAEVPAQ
jgi:hypothetical protein